jgi:hypothetical protein
MRALVIVILDPMLKPLTRIGERGKHRLTQVLPPKRLPEPLDLPERHRVMRSTPHMLDPLLLEHALESRLPAPRHELPGVVAQDLPWGAPLTYRTLEHFQHRLGCLLSVQTPAYDETAVVIEDPDQVDPVESLELEGEDIDLPHGVGQRAFEAPWSGLASVRHRWRVAKPCGVHHAAHLLRTYREAVFATQLVSDPTHTVLGIVLTVGEDLLLELRALLTHRDRGGAPRQTRNSLLAVLSVPVRERRRPHANHRRDVAPVGAALQSLDRQELHLHRYRR